jgi:hypothetical protein
VAACGGGSSGGNTPTSPTPTPTQTNRPPVITSMNVTPSFGVSELTTFTYSVSATDADNDPVSYAWELPGTTRSGQAGTLTLVGSGLAQVRVTATDGRGGSITDTRTITVGSMTGTWRGGGVNLGEFQMTLVQNGPVITGTYFDADYGEGRIDPAQPGTINAAGRIEMRMKQAFFTDFTFRGEMDQSGRRVIGQIYGSGFNGEAFQMDKQ